MHYATDKNTIVLKKKNACHYASDKNTLDLSWEKKNQIFLAPPPHLDREKQSQYIIQCLCL